MIFDRFDSNKLNAAKEENAVNYAESPITYNYDMFSVATDRYNIIKEVNALCSENGDIRFQRANFLIAEDATKGGFSVVVNGSEKDRKRKMKMCKEMRRLTPGANYAQSVIDDFLKRTKLNVLCNEHAAALLREGDIFLNVIIDLNAKLVLQVKRAPVLTMKRNSDEYGEFKDIEKAFSQIDPLVDMHYFMYSDPPKRSREDFAIYQMNHIRWLSDETKLYGKTQYAVARKAHRKLEEMEKSLAYRRMFRSVSKRAHRLERATDPKDITEYKRANAMIDVNGNPTKNAHLLSDFIGNVEIKSLNDEANLDQIKDIELMENVLWVNLLVPKAVITGGQSINRDVLKVQYPHYLQSLNTITDHLEYGDSFMYSGYRAIIDLQLLLAGINPDSVSYDVVWSQKSWETTAERVESIQNALGGIGGKQLISHEKAIQLVAEDFDIEDPATMYQKILEENRINKISDSNIDKTPESKKRIIKNLKNESSTNLKVQLTDEHEENKKQMDQLIGSFTKEWNSFFSDLFDVLKLEPCLMDIENIVNQAERAWDSQLSGFLPSFFMDYVTDAGVLGVGAAEKCIQPEIEKAILEDAVRVQPHIQSNDIYQDLWNHSGKRIKKIKFTTLRLIRDRLALGFDSDAGWEDIMDRIRPIIMDFARAEMIATTELSWAYNRSTERVYRNAGISGLVWHGSDDIKTCDYCRGMKGNVYSIDDHPDNPAHPRCRCTWLPTTIDKGEH